LYFLFGYRLYRVEQWRVWNPLADYNGSYENCLLFFLRTNGNFSLRAHVQGAAIIKTTIINSNTVFLNTVFELIIVVFIISRFSAALCILLETGSSGQLL